MKDKIFLDTNILIYIYSKDIRKKGISLDIIENKDCYISSQVLQEFISVLRKKYKLEWPALEKGFQQITSTVKIYTNTISTISKACKIAEKYKYSFYDSLIVTSALEVKCHKLYTEDLHSGQVIENKLEIINPY